MVQTPLPSPPTFYSLLSYSPFTPTPFLLRPNPFYIYNLEMYKSLLAMSQSIILISKIKLILCHLLHLIPYLNLLFWG